VQGGRDDDPRHLRERRQHVKGPAGKDSEVPRCHTS
jgi:hypothetical protein